jgi:biopolymer transport protein TolR
LGDDSDGILNERKLGRRRLSSEINVTPLIDVLLVLLIIFMVIVPVMPRGLNSALPSSAPTHVADNVAERPILVEVEVEQGEAAVRYLVDGVGVERAEVAPRLVELLSRRYIRQVLLKGGREAGFRCYCRSDRRRSGCRADSIGLVTAGVYAPPK